MLSSVLHDLHDQLRYGYKDPEHRHRMTSQRLSSVPNKFGRYRDCCAFGAGHTLHANPLSSWDRELSAHN